MDMAVAILAGILIFLFGFYVGAAGTSRMYDLERAITAGRVTDEEKEEAEALLERVRKTFEEFEDHERKGFEDES